MEIRGLNIASLEYCGQANRAKTCCTTFRTGDENLPSTLLEKSELERLLAEGIERIPAIERTVLGLYYQEELTLREIARDREPA